MKWVIHNVDRVKNCEDECATNNLLVVCDIKSQSRNPLPPYLFARAMNWSYFCSSCSSEQKQYLLDVGIFVVLQSILNSLTLSADVIAEVFCVIACLSDICKLPNLVHINLQIWFWKI